MAINWKKELTKEDQDFLLKVNAGEPIPEVDEPAAKPLPSGLTLKEILTTEFPEPTWVIPGMIPAGLTVLAGAPKIGKSWLALCLALALGTGGRALGKIEVEQAGVCYLALEDTPRRLQDRLIQVGASNVLATGAGAGMNFFFDWQRGEDAINDIETFLALNPGVKFVIIDTLQKIREPSRRGINVYELDYEAVGLLKKIADKHTIAVIIIHHTRKSGAGDPVEAVSGSFGITGSADTVITLTRARGEADAKLFITGRDVEEQELALRQDPFAGWILLGEAKEYEMTKERREVLEVFEQAGEPLSPKEVAEILGKPAGNVRRLVAKLTKEGLLNNTSYSKYVVSSK